VHSRSTPCFNRLTGGEPCRRMAERAQMPIWGEAFMVEALDDRSIDPKDSAMIVQGRLLSVVRYIESLQIQ
jgi:hypothetical protein